MNSKPNYSLNCRLMMVALSALIVVLAALIAAAQQSSTQQSATPNATPQRQAPPVQIPDKFTNLQVLPKQISKPELVRIMKSFCVTFEKRCSFCHVATDDLSQADFASDEKETKKKARELLRFIRDAQDKPATGPQS